ncbi:hypothetical protein GCM10007424_10260 [Flavobacterium suaedae]|uniref:2-dehydro-3-deoxyphosphooctonate aldolase n=1 Tax=Flavobacterium suaedae TaxID=1767027 RepID=A0ABQ1JMH2_9FLAO|nr:2-dehydro-3-deoxyphosphooctonate aldolase [Flavobacterium suaedae]GGB72220.1 hypothetical protein GCM10007424_10260 [Flavobacterium suaedae]
MNKILFFFLACILLGCASSGTATSKVADDYGYSESNPIKVGGFSNGPANERAYLQRLRTVDGKSISFERRGSCCMFETKSSPFGGGMLDIYEIKVKGDTVKKILYLNMYDKGKLYAPKGFVLK